MSTLVIIAIVYSVFIYAVVLEDLIIQRDVAAKEDNDTVYRSPLFSLTKDRHSPSRHVSSRAKENERTLFSKWPRSGGREHRERESQLPHIAAYCVAALDISDASTFCKNCFRERSAYESIWRSARFLWLSIVRFIFYEIYIDKNWSCSTFRYDLTNFLSFSLYC